MVEFMYKQVFHKTKEVLVDSQFLTLTCNEVTIVDNQSRILILVYVLQDWIWFLLLISFEHVIERGSINNFI
jgi:hypothetical protein